MIPLGVLASARVAPSGPVLLDTFTRADSALRSTVADTGQTWAGPSDSFVVASGKAKANVGGDNFASVNAGLSDFHITATVYKAAAGPALVFRGAGGTLAHFWTVELSNTAVSLLRKGASGAFSSIASATGLTIANAATHTIEVTASGADITVKLDGTTRITHSDSTYQTQTWVGLYQWSTAANLWDDITVEALP